MTDIYKAVEYVKQSYADGSKGLPCLLLGDVSELINILTGVKIDWYEFVQDSTPSFVQDCANPIVQYNEPFTQINIDPYVQDCTDPFVQEIKYIHIKEK